MGGLRLIADCRNELGEGPLWLRRRERLIWFDINRRRLFVHGDARWRDKSDSKQTPPNGGNKAALSGGGGDFRVFDLPCRASAGMETADGNLLVATERGLAFFDLDDGAFVGDFFTPLESAADNRSNDGKGAPDGAFWLGTMDSNLRPDRGAIYRITAPETSARKNKTGGSGDGDKSRARFIIQKKIAPLSIPNALAFAPDGKTLYYADSPRRLIWACDVDDGGISRRRVFASLEGDTAIPDGAATDAAGYLWVALWDGARLARYAPDGKIAATINLPITRPTCPAFGGAGLKTLFITSAREGLSDAGLIKKQPQAGGLFAVETDTPGLPPPLFGIGG
jgi:sugar lactone lactonase YvrE